MTAIDDKYATLGGSSGWLGQPTTAELDCPDHRGRFRHFEGGSIYWTSQTGAWEVHGAIRDKWASLGWETSFLGYPLTDEMTTPDGRGRYNHFEGGSIYWTPQTSAWEVHGAIRDKWASLGWETGFLGYPITDELSTPGGVARYCHFEGGSIFWSPQTGAWELRRDPSTAVEAALTQFEASTTPGVWPYIGKDQLIADMRATIRNPFNVDQGQTAFCGPAAIVFELVLRYPRRYVELCRALYETGKCRGRTKEIRPSGTLLRSGVPNVLSVADWMLMAVFRDAENLLFPVEKTSGPIAQGITTPWEMKGWTSEILGYENVGYTSTYIYGEFDAMKKAQSVHSRGGVAFMMINARMLGQDSLVPSYPDHWVSFVGGLAIEKAAGWDKGHIRFECYSWGDWHHVDLGEGPFEDHMWGLVTGG